MAYLCRTIRVLLSAPLQPPPAHPAKSPIDDPLSTARRVVSGLEVHLHEIVDLLLGKDGWDVLPVPAWVALVIWE